MKKGIDSLSKLILIDILVIVVCTSISIFIFNNVNYNGYQLLFIHPLTYMIIFIFVLGKIVVSNLNRYFMLVFIGVTFLRYVILPFLTVFSNYYGGRSQISPSGDSFEKAILLMTYEFFVIAVFIQMFEFRVKYYKKNNIDYELQTRNDGYIIFIILSLLISFLFPNSYRNLNFIIPTSIVVGGENTSIDNLVLNCLMVCKQLIYILIIKKLYLKYKIQNKNRYVLYSVIVTLISILIYFGSNRMDILITALVSTLLLVNLYGRKIYKYILIMLPIVIGVLVLVSLGRQYATIDNSSSWAILADNIQGYTGGVYNVAIAIETVMFFPEVRSIKVLLMDIFRPMIGINIFLKNIDIPYSNIFFNNRIWLSIDRRSQILPMIGQGYIFLGFIFSVIFPLVFIRLQYWFEKIISNTISLEVYFFVGLSLARLGLLMGQNTMNLINDISLNLFLFSIIYLFNKRFKLRK